MLSLATSLGELLGRIVLMSVFIYSATTTILNNDVSVPPIMYCLTTACLAVLISYFFIPTEKFRNHIAVIPFWSMISALIVYVLCYSYSAAYVPGWRSALLATGVFIMVVSISCIHIILEGFIKDRHLTLSIIVTILIVLSLAPIWLSPMVYMYGDNEQFINIVINISPISYLASMADYDYLRSSWFYQNTAYGAYRYMYLKPSTGTLINIMLCIFLSFLFWRFMRIEKKTSSSIL